jgi:hypothetical protein
MNYKATPGYKVNIINKVKSLTIAVIFSLLLPLIFQNVFLLKDSKAQTPLLYCDDAAIIGSPITPSGSLVVPGVNCLMRSCSSLLVKTIANLGVNCISLDCSDPSLTNLSRYPGVNCIMKSCSDSSLVGSPSPNVNCVMTDCKNISNADAILTSSLANCSYMGLPLCSSLLNPNNRKHRVNCADLIDLPLETDIKTSMGHSINLGKNSVRECKNIPNPNPANIPALQRGVDYAVFNQSCTTSQSCNNQGCIRFCDDVEAGITASNGVNCVTRKCNQPLLNNAAPTPSGNSANCSMQNCVLLTSDELNDARFGVDATKYCEGDNIKCYQFSQEQLPFVKQANINIAGSVTMCQLHKCPPPNGITSCGINDTLYITSQSSSYQSLYSKYICGNMSLSQMCLPIICKPIIKRAYRCLPKEDTNPTTPNSLCDQTGDNANCDAMGFCYKTIDCNLNINASLKECISSSLPDDEGDSSNTSSIDAWFYRPIPLHGSSKGVDDNGVVKQMHFDLSSDDYKKRLCYNKGDLEDNNWGWHPIIDLAILGQIDLGYFHAAVFPDHSRSPGLCSNQLWGNIGNRGIGYLNLCGTKALMYNAPDPLKTAYIKTYTSADYTQSPAKFYLTVCTRFKNTLAFEENTDVQACGKRECAITCTFGECSSQACGFDVCKDLVITDTPDSNKQDCQMSDAMMTGSPSKNCLAKIDETTDTDGVRVRAVKYSNKLCAFMDVRGHLAYDQLNKGGFFTGNEMLDDGLTCISGDGENGSCNGFDSTKNHTTISNYRTIMLIPYIANLLADNSTFKGYYDKSGRLFKAQQCANIPLKISPPLLYNLANINNSKPLFYPPLYIANSKIIRGGIIASSSGSDTIGTTDFFFPEITVSFGSATKLMSLGAGYSGYENKAEAENDYPNSPAWGLISTVVGDLTYSVNIFVRKEYDSTSFQPLFCLYQEVKDTNGNPLDPLQIGCVKRKYPEINSYLNPLIPISKMVVLLDSSSKYNDPTMNIRYMANPGPNNIDNNCGGDDVCSPQVNSTPIQLKNPDFKVTTCNYSPNYDLYPAERYPLCIQRDPCSKLNIECIDNEVEFFNAKQSGIVTNFTTYLNIRNNCNNVILPACNLKKGISADFTNLATIYNQNPEGIAANSKAYGWFNEICIVLGFQTKLRPIIAYQVLDINNQITGLPGKCVVADPIACPNGGKAPECPCIDAQNNLPDINQIIRLETPHEAGLCVDIILPKICQAITYNFVPSAASNNTDPDYIYQSLNKSSYNDKDIHDASGVDISHKYRNIGNNSPSPAIILAGHADFSVAFQNTQNIEGICKGFWKNDIVNNISTPPTLSCIVDSQGNVGWDLSGIKNPCKRYSCDEITTSGPDMNGIYQGNYGLLEIGENKGLSNGFALWPSHTQNSDFVENVTANSCIYGFKPAGSSAININNQPTTYINNSAITTNGAIANYLGGTLPIRQCNQLGTYLTATNNVCVRITCPAINPLIPSGASDTASWNGWIDSAGASFNAVNASRSNLRIQVESISVGSCNNNLGFFQINNPPTRACDYLGNWQPVQNPCTTQCDALDTVTGNSSNNGYSMWDAIEVQIGSSQPGVFKGCITSPAGYIPNPYYGNPTRSCNSVYNANTGVISNLWSSIQNPCINQCQGGIADPTHGITTHNTSTGTITITWSNTPLSTSSVTSYAYAYDQSNLTAQNFQQNRIDHHYLLRRKCNSDGSWDPPEPICAVNNVSLGSAKYNISNAITSNANSIAIGQTVTAYQCVTGNWTSSRGIGALPIRQCKYLNSSNNIDQIYLGLTNSDCEAITCAATINQTFGNSLFNAISVANSSPVSNTASTYYYSLGATVSLNCKNNYGKAIGASPRNVIASESEVCGSPSILSLYSASVNAHAWSRNSTATVNVTTNRIVSKPSITCASNGAWSLVANDCTACLSCDGGDGGDNGPQIGYYYDGSTGSYPGYGECTVHNDSGWREFCTKSVGCYYYVSLPDALSGGFVTNSVDGGSSGNRYHGDFAATCYDGTFYITSANCYD